MAAVANEQLQESKGLSRGTHILPGASSLAGFGIRRTLARQGAEDLLCHRGLVGALNPTDKNYSSRDARVKSPALAELKDLQIQPQDFSHFMSAEKVLIQTLA